MIVIDRVVKKLIQLGYDPEKKVEGTLSDVYNIARGHLHGLVLFSGRVIANSGFISVLENDHLYVTSSKIDKECSLYISPLWKRTKEEYIRMYGVQTNDHIRIEDKVIGNIDNFSLIVEDARERPVAIFEFQKRGNMLYVPRKSDGEE